VKLDVAAVLVSVTVAAPIAVPVVSVNVATVLLVTTQLEIEAPATPVTENRVDAVSDSQSVLTPLAVTVCATLSPVPGGNTDIDAVLTAMAPVLVSSEIVQLPAADPVVTLIVAEVVDVIVGEPTIVTPAPVAVNVVVPLIQLVPDPVNSIVMFFA